MLCRSLPDQRRVLPEVADLAPRPSASDPRGLGRARPFLHRDRCRSLQARSSECGNPPARRRALRTGRKDGRDCGPDPPVHGRAFRMSARAASIECGIESPAASRSGTPCCRHAQGPIGLSAAQQLHFGREFTMSGKVRATLRSESAASVMTGGAFIVIDLNTSIVNSCRVTIRVRTPDNQGEKVVARPVS